ncbi:MAG: hypothetical protein K6E40_18590 [Desulfovibrio sp.]|nr:hypothetical protein [Desulfovibrio sp.]
MKGDGAELEFVPEALRTPDLCRAACEGSGWALEFVPDALKTEEMCLSAVKNNAWALEHVPKGMKTLEIVLEAVLGDEFAAEQFVSDRWWRIFLWIGRPSVLWGAPWRVDLQGRRSRNDGASRRSSVPEFDEVRRFRQGDEGGRSR